MLKSGIYLIRCLVTGLCYVGQSVDINARKYMYRKGHTTKQRRIYNAIQKYGFDAFSFEILELCDESDLNAREIFWIASLDTLSPNGYNLKSGGKGGGRPSHESRRKIGEANKRRPPPSAETRRKLSEAGKGRKHTSESRRKIGEANKCRAPHSAETKAKMSEAARRRPPLSDESRRKIGEAHKGNTYGRANKGKKYKRKVKKSSRSQLNLFG